MSLHFKYHYLSATSRLSLLRLTRPACILVRMLGIEMHRRLTTVATSDLIEELLPHYNAKHFFPVEPGKVFRERFETIAKLGYGGGSTVWLARDLNL
jgi:hypothetical protein